MAKIHDNGGVIGKTLDFTSIDTYTTGSTNKKNSGIWNLSSAIPFPKPDYSIFNYVVDGTTETSPYNQAYELIVIPNGPPVGTTVAYTSTSTLSYSDFENGGLILDPGTFTIQESGGLKYFIISFTMNEDLTTEGTETLSITLAATDSAGNQTGSPTLTFNITDSSVTPISGVDYSTFFTPEISNRHIDSDTYMGSSADYNGPYDVHQTDPVLASPNGSTARVYLAVKYTSSTTFYSDLPIAGVQHFNSSGTLQNSWIFNTSTGGSGSTWQTTTAAVSQGATGMSTTPAQAAGLTYTSISSGSSTNRMNWATSTGSSYTGAADGISSTYYSTAITTGTANAAIPQVSGTYYMYAEASGVSIDTAVFARSPAVTISDGDYFVIVHAVTGYSANRQDANDCLWFGIY